MAKVRRTIQISSQHPLGDPLIIHYRNCGKPTLCNRKQWLLPRQLYSVSLCFSAFTLPQQLLRNDHLFSDREASCDKLRIILNEDGYSYLFKMKASIDSFFYYGEQLFILALYYVVPLDFFSVVNVINEKRFRRRYAIKPLLLFLLLLLLCGLTEAWCVHASAVATAASRLFWKLR